MQYSLSTLQARSGLVLSVFPFEGNFSVFPSGSVVGVNSPCLHIVLHLLSWKWSAFPAALGLPKTPRHVPGRATHRPPPARAGPADPSRKLPPPSRCDRVLAGLRTVKLIVPAGSGERRGLRKAPGCRWAQFPRELKWGSCAPRAGCAPASGAPGADTAALSSRVSRVCCLGFTETLCRCGVKASVRGRDTENIVG